MFINLIDLFFVVLNTLILFFICYFLLFGIEFKKLNNIMKKGVNKMQTIEEQGYKHGQDTAKGIIGSGWMIKINNVDASGWIETLQFEHETKEQFNSMSNEDFYHEFVYGWINGYNENEMS